MRKRKKTRKRSEREVAKVGDGRGLDEGTGRRCGETASRAKTR